MAPFWGHFFNRDVNMCEFGDRVYQVCKQTETDVSFDHGEDGLYAFLSRYGEPGKPAHWLVLLKIDESWRGKLERWQQEYQKEKAGA